MKNIAVFGFPKSGNTWLTRLLAECIDCPSSGFWGYDENYGEMAKEGLNRKSKYEVWKGHYSVMILKDLYHPIDISNVIYIVRDIRDIICSAVHYFKELRDRNIDKAIDYMNNPDWLKNCDCRNWNMHVNEWLDKKVYYVRYEDLLMNAREEIMKIFLYLDIQRDDEHIRTSIYNQSFNVKKRKLRKIGKSGYAEFLRKGISGQYKEVFTKQQMNKANKLFGKTLKRLGY